MDIVVSYDCVPTIGGAHLWLYEVYRRWPGEVSLLTLERSGDPIAGDAPRPCDTETHGALTIFRDAVAVPNVDLADPRCLNRFRLNVRRIRRLAGKGPLQLHSLRAFPEGFTSLLCAWTRRGATRLITYAHGEETLIARSSGQLAWMARRVYAASDLVIANSENTSRLVRELCPVAHITCIRPGVEAQAFKLRSEDLCAYRLKWGWPRDTVVLYTVARMEPRKNHAAVIKAVSVLRGEGLPLAYVCGGDGSERGRLVQLATSLGISEWVRFTGAISEEEKKLIFAAADIHVMPSVRAGELIEGFGIVFLEAAAAGKPSICGSDGGQAEAVRDGKTGIVVDGSSDEQLREAIRKLATDTAARAQMGQAGLAWAAEHDWSLVARRTELQVRRLHLTMT
jgi:phosphatidylinositol alpha-1,6-mannosyltransferase